MARDGVQLEARDSVSFLHSLQQHVVQKAEWSHPGSLDDSTVFVKATDRQDEKTYHVKLFCPE